MAYKPLILISNDDSINSPGIAQLVSIMQELGEVIVVAPAGPQSAQGHSITIEDPIHLDKVNSFPGVLAYQCSGTPVDCVKIAIDKILPRRPDLMVSGINHGSNSSINVLYSGTMSAAVEASIDGMPAIGFSLCDYSWDADFGPARPFIKMLAQEMLNKSLPYGNLLNVNIPKGEIKGVKICRQAQGRWKEDFDRRETPFGKEYFWMTGEFVNMDEKDDTDEYALSHGYISVVPTMFDLTAHSQIDALKQWNLTHPTK
jgi:5'-nucleotidase